jgi:predicted glycoside hydrolase/deacetylase ChbG (UPF0249 family)
MDLIWYCCDDYGLNIERDRAILRFIRDRRRVRISVFPFASRSSISELKEYVLTNGDCEIQIGAHLYLSEFLPVSQSWPTPLFSDKNSLALGCTDSTKRRLILDELMQQLSTLSNCFTIEFINFHHNIHHTREFIEFLSDQKDLPIHSLRNVGIVATGLGGLYNRIIHPKTYALHRRITSSFRDEKVNLFMSGKRYLLWRYLTRENLVELMFHPGDKRSEYISECKAYEI